MFMLKFLATVAQGQSAPAPEQAWASERFSDLASAQLKQWAESLLRGESDTALFESKASCKLAPSAWTTVTEDRFLRVREAKGSAKAMVPSEALSGLTPEFVGQKAAKVKFKVFAVEPKPSWMTRLYFLLAGPTPEGYLERNAVWQATWKWDEKSAPTITSAELIAVEEVLLKGQAAPRFTESTQAVLGGTSAFRDQLRFGTDHWRQRVELFNRFFKFGQNGLAMGDANGDGREDLYVCQNGGLPNRLFIQQADGTAKEVAAEAGVDLLDLTRSALFVDLDNDGDQDLVVAADSGLLAYRNDGKGHFEPKVRYPAVRNAHGIAAADYDNDGDVDLYVCRYFATQEEGAGLAVPVPYYDANNGGANFLIRNEGPAKRAEDWLNFSDATKESGLETQNNRRFSFAAVWEDLDNDGDQDLFVANDFGLKNLYVNEGGKFRDTALASNIDDGGFGMSAASGDYDNDGIMDLYAGNMFSAAGSRVTRQPQFRPGLDSALLTRFQRMARGNSLFRGLGGQDPPRFADVSEETGVTVGRWSWGSLFADLNNDGWEDIFVANGFVTGSAPDDL